MVVAYSTIYATTEVNPRIAPIPKGTPASIGKIQWIEGYVVLVGKTHLLDDLVVDI